MSEGGKESGRATYKVFVCTKYVQINAGGTTLQFVWIASIRLEQN